MLVWDTEAIFEFCGGVDRVLKICAQAAPLNIPPKPGTVAIWKHRGRISAEWLPAVVQHCIDHGMSVNALFCDSMPGAPEQSPSLDDVGL